MDTIGKTHPMPHFFHDIETLNLHGTFSASDTYTAKRRRIQRSVLVDTQVCNTHCWGEDSVCTVPSADFGCSGLPCTDMSRAGRQLKRHGLTNSVYMTHGKFVETKRVPLFIIECTPESWLYSWFKCFLIWKNVAKFILLQSLFAPYLLLFPLQL